MPSPVVSVVIPTFNRTRSLTRAVDSALIQGPAVEVLIIDDGSTDGTAELVRSRYGADPRVRYTYQKNQGAGAARNEGLKQARGEFVAFLDSDDIWLPDKLDLQVACLRALPDAGMVWSDMEAVDVQQRHVHPRYLRVMYHAYRRFPRSEDLFTARTVVRHGDQDVRVYYGEIFSPMVLGNLVHTSTVLLRRGLATGVGGFREKFRKAGEDFDYHLRVCREGPVAFVDAVTIKYEVGAPDAITRPELDFDIATGFIATLQDTLARDRDRITVPDGVISETLAGAYVWAGRAALDSGRAAEARTMYGKSLRLRPFRPATLKFFLVACLPGALRRRLRAMVRTVRAWRGRAGPLAVCVLVVFGPALATPASVF